MSALLKIVDAPAPRPLAAGEPPAPPPKKRKKRKQPGHPYLQFEEVAAFFKAIDRTAPAKRRERDRAIFRLAYHAGLRASEVGGLQLRDYNPRTDRIFVQRLKGSNPGEHHLMREEARALRAWLKLRGSEAGPIFLSRNHRPISRYQLDELMKQYGEAAGIPPTLRHMHIWKHTCCTHLRTMGKSVEDIQDWVGHVNIQNSLEYSHITSARREEIAKVLRDTWR